MPKILGIVVLSGVLAAGISSATTFLSLIGSNVANDMLALKDERKSIRAGKLAILVAAVIILVLCVLNPPAIFWITYLGATIIACSWMPVAIASIWSKRVTKTGAFCGMLVGFIVNSVMKVYLSAKGITLPIYFDPFFVGLASNLIAMVIGSALTKVTDEEKEQRAKLFIMPAEELDIKEIRKTKICVTVSVFLGAIVTAILLTMWVIPYLNGLN